MAKRPIAINIKDRYRLTVIERFDARKGFIKCAFSGITVSSDDGPSASADAWRNRTGNLFVRFSSQGEKLYFEASLSNGEFIPDSEITPNDFGKFIANNLIVWVTEGLTIRRVPLWGHKKDRTLGVWGKSLLKQEIKMRALSVRQPFADQIIKGTKRVEYRSRPTNIRGRVYVYASETPGSPKGESLRRGVVIGTVEIHKCTGKPNDYQWHLRNPKPLAKPKKPTGRPQPVWFNPFP